MLCEKCHEREATIQATNVAGENITTVNLCAECFEGAGCHYCGGERFSSAPDLSAHASGKQKLLPVCDRCSAESYGFLQRRLPGFDPSNLTPELISGLPSLLAELDRHMKQWVLERRVAMFSEQFRQRIAKGKYARWAVDLTEDQLEALLSVVGEYGSRSNDVFKVLQSAQPPKDDIAYARAVLALEVLAEFVRGHPISEDGYIKRLGRVMEDVRAHGG